MNPEFNKDVSEVQVLLWSKAVVTFIQTGSYREEILRERKHENARNLSVRMEEWWSSNWEHNVRSATFLLKFIISEVEWRGSPLPRTRTSPYTSSYSIMGTNVELKDNADNRFLFLEIYNTEFFLAFSP
jgi:hypothetical protein